MIVVKIRGGIGNQLFQYAIGRVLSIHLNKKLFFDINYYSNQKKSDTRRFFMLDNFNINYDYYDYILPDSVFNLAKKLKIDTFRTLNFIHYIESETINFNELLNSSTNQNIYLYGYWQSYLYFKDYLNFIFEELTPKSSLNCSSQNLINKIIESENSTSIHIRRGDYINNINASQINGIIPLSYYYSALKIIQEKYNSIEIFVFSDDFDWVKNNFKHSDNVTFVNCNISEVDSWQDIVIMSHCKHHILANSTFSWWGSLISCKYFDGDRICIAPKRWFINESLNVTSHKMHPENWILL